MPGSRTTSGQPRARSRGASPSTSRRRRGDPDLVNPEFGFECRNAEGVTVFGFKRSLDDGPEEPAKLATGERAQISATIEGVLMQGTYYIRCWVVRDSEAGEIGLQFIDILKFEVIGGLWGPGIVSVPAEMRITTEEDG